MSCPKHPRYKAKRPPTADCAGCREQYSLANGGGKSLEEFDAAHNPRHVLNNFGPQWDQPTPKGCKVFIVTAAQNATPVHPEFWAILQAMAEHRKAQLLVVPLRYKNATSQWLGSQQNAEHWDIPVANLQNVRKVLNPNLVLLADVKTQPTAKDPLTGYDAMSSDASAILGHTKLQLRCIATPSNKMAKILTTTGACTVQNYSDGKAGKIGEFHHSLSATIVELDGKRFHLRQLHYHAVSQSVTDGARGLRYCYDGESRTVGAEKAPRPLALVSGDIHVDFADPQVIRATDEMLGELNPEHDVLHDLLDAYSCNPHHWGNPMNAIAKRRVNADDVKAEVDRAGNFVRARLNMGDGDRKVVVIPSNHDNMLARWILRSDWKLDPTNAEFYLRTALAMSEGCRITERGTEYPDPFVYWLRNSISRGTLITPGESFVVGGVELGMHGDRGPNGARGSIRNLRRIGVKSIIGHSHTPGIDEGCYQAGTSTRLRLEYNNGPSAWLNAHCLLQWDGKRQLVFVIDGKWRA